MKHVLAFLAVTFALLLTWHVVSAHAIPLACLPRIGTSVKQPPEQLICQFSDPLNPNNISMTVMDTSGQRVDKDDLHFYNDDDHTLVVSLDTAKMPQGIYNVKWQVQDTVDQGLTYGEFQFGVNTVLPPTPTPVLPGVAMTPVPVAVQPTTNPTADLISRFFIGVAVVVLAAVGILFWRMRASEKQELESDVE
jgi:methionine-rich copper-binding protein CopC